MDKYKLRGSYKLDKFPLPRNFHGDLIVNPLHWSGEFESYINDQFGAYPNQVIRGYIREEEDLTRMLFIKHPVKEKESNLIYNLKKPKDGKTDGLYQGIWQVMPYNVQFSTDYNTFLTSIALGLETEKKSFAKVELIKFD